jgi:peptidoglycan/xylan/chitin deacetylase (PgdA/CDA1 family)
MALQRYPELTQAFMDLGHEIASHGLRWIHYQNLPEATERRHMALATHVIRDMTNGVWPLGWYTGRDSPNTRRLLAEAGGYEYDSDYYGDDLPFWEPVTKTDGSVVQQLIVPYSLDTNDMRFVQAQGFNTGEHFLTYLKDSFDALYAEGEEAPKMMSIGMHCRLLGKPGRIGSLQKFLDYIQSHERVWICRRIDIARHWRQTFPAPL